MKRLVIATTIAVMLGCGACNKSPGPAAAAPAVPGLPTKAQPKLQTTKLWLGTEELVAELALTGEQQQTGMMFREKLGENEGMLFVFPYPHQTSFWMKNTIVPLSAAYIDPEGTILEIHALQPHNTNSVVASSSNIQFVLEVNQGWFDRHHVSTGMLVRTESGPLKALLRR